MFKEDISKCFNDFWKASADYGRAFQKFIEANPKRKELLDKLKARPK